MHKAMPTVSLHTLGCKLNFAETSMLGKQFVDRGFSIVDFGQPADVCVINTCSVTERANRECRQMIRRAVRTSANPLIVVTGCYAQLEPEQVAAIKGVDVVLGAREKFEIFDHLGGLEKKLYPHVFVSDIGDVAGFGISYTTGIGDRTRAFLKVQDGCDYQCSFCTIPRARGGSRSQGMDETIAQARRLVDQGFKEITLTGVNVGDYGAKRDGGLLPLLRALLRMEGLERVRISSIEPNLLTDEILELVASEPKACNHFHIPLQSGSDKILHLMRRRYDTRFYRTLVDKIHRKIPGCGIGADLIAGFPGETERLFQDTLSFVEELPVSYLHVFTYSERPDTPAAALPDSVEPKVRFKRNEILRSMGLSKKLAFYGNLVGTTAQVLVEDDVQSGMRYGFTDNYVRVALPADAAGANTMVPVEITAVREGVCRGRIADGREAA